MRPAEVCGPVRNCFNKEDMINCETKIAWLLYDTSFPDVRNTANSRRSTDKSNHRVHKLQSQLLTA